MYKLLKVNSNLEWSNQNHLIKSINFILTLNIFINI